MSAQNSRTRQSLHPASKVPAMEFSFLGVGPMPEQAFEAQLSRVGRNPWIMGVAGLPFLGTLALLIAGIFNPHYFFGVPHTIVLGGVATLYAWRKNFSPVM